MTKNRHTRWDCNPGCEIEAAVSLIDGKWKCVILYHLLEGAVRYNELRRKIPCITQRILTAQLRELETDDLIVRKIYPQVPPKVEYSLSPVGMTFKPILLALGEWGKDNLPKFTARLETREPSSQENSLNVPEYV